MITGSGLNRTYQTREGNEIRARQEVTFESRSDVYQCPADQRAIHRFNTVEHYMALRVHWPSACPRCNLKDRCSPSDYRRIRRWEHENILEPCNAGSTGSPSLDVVWRSYLNE